jgi:hypothetical protein
MNDKQSKSGKSNVKENFKGRMAFSEASPALAMVLAIMIVLIRHSY